MKWIKRWNIWFVPGEEAQYRYVLYDGDQAEYTDYQAKKTLKKKLHDHGKSCLWQIIIFDPPFKV